mmetsp:Transcript_15482/g.50646  ORF Transcript_15482/g.50646 Transcript_15482/m.50646 type:complete len:414 (-) Transcript_15482:296-1537(-)
MPAPRSARPAAYHSAAARTVLCLAASQSRARRFARPQRPPRSRTAALCSRCCVSRPSGTRRCASSRARCAKWRERLRRSTARTPSSSAASSDTTRRCTPSTLSAARSCKLSRSDWGLASSAHKRRSLASSSATAWSLAHRLARARRRQRLSLRHPSLWRLSRWRHAAVRSSPRARRAWVWRAERRRTARGRPAPAQASLGSGPQPRTATGGNTWSGRRRRSRGASPSTRSMRLPQPTASLFARRPPRRALQRAPAARSTTGRLQRRTSSMTPRPRPVESRARGRTLRQRGCSLQRHRPNQPSGATAGRRPRGAASTASTAGVRTWFWAGPAARTLASSVTSGPKSRGRGRCTSAARLTGGSSSGRWTPSCTPTTTSEAGHLGSRRGGSRAAIAFVRHKRPARHEGRGGARRRG